MTETPTGGEAAIQTAILAYLREELLPESTEVTVEDDLLSGELLDSMAILRLATFVDETFSIGMKPSDFRVENFQSVHALTNYVLSTA